MLSRDNGWIINDDWWYNKTQVLDSCPLNYSIISFQQGIVPSQLKIAKVIPVFKKGDKTRIENDRPISLLSIFDKVFFRKIDAQKTV